jgi:dolichol kinase
VQFRKIIHILGVLIPLAAGVIGKIQTLALVMVGFCIYLVLEALKPKIKRVFLLMVYRENELKGLSIEPFSYFLSVMSLLFLSFFINEKLCFAAIAILAVGDGFAGAIGKGYGKHSLPFNENKSWEGSFAGLIAASVTGFYFAGSIAIIGSIFGMLADAISKNDNLAVPYAALASMLIVKNLFPVI